MAKEKAKPKRAPGQIETLPSGSLRVKLYAGLDPISGDRVYLRETVPAGPDAEKEAEKVLVRFRHEVNERRHPKTNATIEQLIERHLADAKLGFKTRKNYRSQADKHILKCVGAQKVRAFDAAIADSFYTELRRCRDHCDGRPQTRHRTAGQHQCDPRCNPHVCEPLKESSILYIHQILSGAFRRAVRLKWVSVSPIDFAEPPAPPKANPRPPSVDEAARIVTEAWKDPDWGTLIWLTMMTGNRRGELCGTRWRHVNLADGVLHIQRAIGQYGGETWEKGTKDEEDRRIVLDPETVLVLSEHRERCALRAGAVGLNLTEDGFVFSRDPAGRSHLKPDSVSQRYGRLVERLGIDTSIRKLRTYNATELLTAGLDLRTAAGRLGHSGGGVTTMKHYVPWTSEADQRAAGSIVPRVPARPRRQAELPPRVEIEAKHPFEKLALLLRDRIYEGHWAIGLRIPSAKALAREHGISSSTAQRAVQLLSQWGLVRIEPGVPTLVAPQTVEVTTAPVEVPANSGDTHTGPQSLELEVRRLGVAVATLRTKADPTDSESLHRLLIGAVKRHGCQPAEVEDFELIVRAVGDETMLATYVAVAP